MKSDRLAYFVEIVKTAMTQGDRVDTTDGHESVVIWARPAAIPMLPSAPEKVRTYLTEQNATAPKGNYQELTWIGTKPGFQGRGLGSALISRGLERNDNRDLATAVWTVKERSRKLFERHGYKVQTKLAPEFGPVGWSLWRDARSKAAPSR